MKRLKNKVFWVIFLLLTSFISIILITSTTKAYFERKRFVSDNLTRIPRTFANIDIKNDNKNPNFMPPMNQESRRIFLDSTIYTIVLDENNNYKGIINNTSNDELDEENIEKIAKNIIASHKDNLYIGNLYTNRYAYTFTSNNTLIIMDNYEINTTLTNQLISNILLFMICEIIIFIITYLITKWIITPVKKSFEKQSVN